MTETIHSQMLGKLSTEEAEHPALPLRAAYHTLEWLVLLASVCAIVIASMLSLTGPP